MTAIEEAGNSPVTFYVFSRTPKHKSLVSILQDLDTVRLSKSLRDHPEKSKGGRGFVFCTSMPEPIIAMERIQ